MEKAEQTAVFFSCEEMVGKTALAHSKAPEKGILVQGAVQNISGGAALVPQCGSGRKILRGKGTDQQGAGPHFLGWISWMDAADEKNWERGQGKSFETCSCGDSAFGFSIGP